MATEISPLTEVAAAVGDELFGPTSERGVNADDGRRRRRRSAYCSTAARSNGDSDSDSVCGWLSSSSLQASNHFLRFPSDYPNLDMEIVFGFALFSETLFVVVGISKWFSVLFIAFPVFGSIFYIASNGYNLEGRISFSSFCC